MTGAVVEREFIFGFYENCGICPTFKQEPLVKSALETGRIANTPVRQIDAVRTEEGRRLLLEMERQTGRQGVPSLFLRERTQGGEEKICVINAWEFAKKGTVPLRCGPGGDDPGPP